MRLCCAQAQTFPDKVTNATLKKEHWLYWETKLNAVPKPPVFFFHRDRIYNYWVRLFFWVFCLSSPRIQMWGFIPIHFHSKGREQMEIWLIKKKQFISRVPNEIINMTNVLYFCFSGPAEHADIQKCEVCRLQRAARQSGQGTALSGKGVAEFAACASSFPSGPRSQEFSRQFSPATQK